MWYDKTCVLYIYVFYIKTNFQVKMILTNW